MLSGGCVIEPPEPSPITVELVNSTTLDVWPNFYTSASATDAAGLFVAGNLRKEITSHAVHRLLAGETVTLSLECNDIQSIGVDAPVLFNGILITVTTSTDRVFRLRGSDFDCGSTVRFEYFTEGDAFRVRVQPQ
jgi:hypothetical protein